MTIQILQLYFPFTEFTCLANSSCFLILMPHFILKDHLYFIHYYFNFQYFNFNYYYYFIILNYYYYYLIYYFHKPIINYSFPHKLASIY